jgi:sigma-B regulation protein RsbU (phosphoserine phosphatase)
VLLRGNRAYLWAHTKSADGEGTISAPLTAGWLAKLLPSVGPATFAAGIANLETGSHAASVTPPPPVNRFDSDFNGWTFFPTLDWEHPNQTGQDGLLAVHSRVSAVVNTVFGGPSDFAQTAVKVGMVALAIIFVFVEIVALFIGISMTRSITGAVHRLYDGTGHIREGDLSHRIQVAGRDQLAELGNSFNQMTANLEQLLVVAKEKERLQSEIEIARDVQSQLFPRSVPSLATLRLKAVCHPARMVSGDYYGFELMHGQQIALAIADVAGKGISAALLMAALQSSLRTQLEDSLEAAATANGASARAVSTSRLVSRLNRQLHASTSPEKYATFWLGVYDDASSVLTYTNAGHLPPLLVRKGEVQRLDVNGTVVGAFSFAQFTESRIELQPEDLLVCFTDGITEPENEYGEMYGEERLMDLLARNYHRGEGEIIDLVISSVRQFARAGEPQDDMTILVARRI